jgi:hypothetical protein
MTRGWPASVVSSYFFGDCSMPNDLTANAEALGQAGGGSKPSSSLYREMGLAAVATELNLQLNTLEPDVAEAVQRGAAALFLASSGRSLTRDPRIVRAGEKGGRRKALRVASNERPSKRFPTGKAEVLKCLAGGTEAQS